MAIPPSMHGRQLGRQLIATSIAIALVLLAIDRVGLSEDLAGDLLIVTIGVTRGVRMDLRAVDRDHPDLRQPRLGAQPQDVAEQSGERCLVALAKTRNRRVIRHLIRRDHPEGDVLNTRPLDHPRRTLAPRVGVEQQRDHHRRIVRRTAMTIQAVGAIEARQIHLLDRRQHEPREMARRQPLPQARRHQQHLLAVTPNEV